MRVQSKVNTSEFCTPNAAEYESMNIQPPLLYVFFFFFLPQASILIPCMSLQSYHNTNCTDLNLAIPLRGVLHWFLDGVSVWLLYMGEGSLLIGETHSAAYFNIPVRIMVAVYAAMCHRGKVTDCSFVQCVLPISPAIYEPCWEKQCCDFSRGYDVSAKSVPQCEAWHCSDSAAIFPLLFQNKLPAAWHQRAHCAPRPPQTHHCPPSSQRSRWKDGVSVMEYELYISFYDTVSFIKRQT